MKKQQRKQQEEAEKDQKRQEKEEAEMKRQLSIQKQVSIMERFLKKSKTSPSQKDQSSTKAATPDSPSKESENMAEAVTLSMDCTLSSSIDINIEDVRKWVLSSLFNSKLLSFSSFTNIKILSYFAGYMFLRGGSWVILFTQTETSTGAYVKSLRLSCLRNLSSLQVE